MDFVILENEKRGRLSWCKNLFGEIGEAEILRVDSVALEQMLNLCY